MALTYHVLLNECLNCKCQLYSNSRSCDPNNDINQCKASISLMNMNIILLVSTTAAPATFISTTCQAVHLWAAGKRQRVTEAKGVALLCCISGKRVVTSAVRETRWNTTSSVVLVKGFMVRTKVARRCVAPSAEGEKKSKRKGKETLVKRKVRVQHV